MKKRLTLAPVELMLMKEIWRRGRATVQQITDAIACKRKLAYSTVLTMMRSLEKKGFLSHTEEDRRYVYSALVDEREVTANMVKDVLNRLFNGSRELFLARLFELRDIDEEELKLLKKIISKSTEPEKKRKGK